VTLRSRGGCPPPFTGTTLIRRGRVQLANAPRKSRPYTAF
jgi:hypothetical protein